MFLCYEIFDEENSLIVNEIAKFKTISYDKFNGGAIIGLGGNFNDIFLDMSEREYEQIYYELKGYIAKSTPIIEIKGLCYDYASDYEMDEILNMVKEVFPLQKRGYDLLVI